ncbi:MAG: hypothetical protein SFT68_01300 [Rickettsiaceae bacterium]|nr:hypothetical protein [Rickettsiaceae bacterium]
MAIIRGAAFNILKRDDEKLPLRPGRVKAFVASDYRAKLLAS